MKKLLCISILLIGYCHAQEIPNLATLKSEYNGNINTLDFLNYIMFRLINPSYGFMGSEKDIEDIIRQWYKEDPALFLTVRLNSKGVGHTIADQFAIDIRTNELLPEKLRTSPTSFLSEFLYRKGTILQVLKQLGLQTLSDEKVNEIAQLQVEKEVAYANELEKRSKKEALGFRPIGLR